MNATAQTIANEVQPVYINVLSIDAWRTDTGGWTWNNWFKIGKISKAEFETLTTNRQIIKWFRDNDYLGNDSKGKVSIDDDQHNIVVCAKGTNEPLFALEYGPAY